MSLAKLSVKELRELAKLKNVKIPSKALRADIVLLLASPKRAVASRSSPKRPSPKRASPNSLQKLTIPELKLLAKNRNIKIPSKSVKADIIRLLASSKRASPKRASPKQVVASRVITPPPKTVSKKSAYKAMINAIKEIADANDIVITEMSLKRIQSILNPKPYEVNEKIEQFFDNGYVYTDDVKVSLATYGYSVKMNLASVPSHIIPPRITALKVFGDSYEDITIPDTITCLEIENCSSPLENIKLSNNLTELKLSSCSTLDRLVLPDSLKVLVIDYCDATNVIFPELNIFKASVSHFNEADLPNNLRVLVVNDCNDFVGNNLPTNLKILDVYGCPNFDCSYVPDKLKYFNMRNSGAECDVSTLRNLNGYVYE